MLLSLQGENADENEAVLDEEMEKVFSEPNISKFDVRKLSDVKPPSSTKLDKLYQQSQQAAHTAHKYNEQDYDSKLTGFIFKQLLLTSALPSASYEVISTVFCATESIQEHE